jgi:hypothetical protein
MLQMTLHLTRSSRLWTLLLLGLEVLRSEKKDTLTVSMEIHKGAIFDRLKIKQITLVFYRFTNLANLFKTTKLK